MATVLSLFASTSNDVDCASAIDEMNIDEMQINEMKIDEMTIAETAEKICRSVFFIKLTASPS